ncbi:quinolinate synthase NadA [Methanosarcina sp. Mfa9]|uniref:quinolinate synthase NadA n=1 Tax=Methanosarcina sp. Mfa9 TaxID=3439063 RepID=UPI003F85CE18
MENDSIIAEISRLKKERNAIILSHYYTRREVQEVADFVGDSFSLCRKAVDSEADVIVFAGVHFMAESASILCPDKLVLLPVPDAGCPMADMVDAPSLRAEKAKHPEAAVVCYVNSSAAVKAESDICCTSSNAVNVVNSLENREILFVPDKNLGAYVALHTDKKVWLWEGFCHVHHNIGASEVEELQKAHPGAKFLAHPECRSEVLDLADHICSTSGIIREVESSGAGEFIIGTERELYKKLKAEFPEKQFYHASRSAVCYNMKKLTLEAILNSLEHMEYEVSVPEHIRVKAKRALDRMLEVP